MFNRQHQQPKLKDRRLLATFGLMWGTLGMMALCIPMVYFTKEATLPLFVIGGSALSIASVWLFGGPKDPTDQSKKVAALDSQLAAMQERLESVETINRFEAQLAADTLGSPEPGERSMGSPVEQEQEKV